ncbi:MAG: hypothetical protein A3B10_03800 [Candidatus Doudnabacteria bacterium RIFCSPLOWO2_01_FULL_44_21]|uniref:Radical SAM core domain-containing protein n=1 Tax=Candidatus Doudnabacteria bacterium RIFCSPLOWO2_01_FULL_44_21 TaxID=1817841 RepID=A0A1F5PYG0_9BACT|nr:MAG: hypothetical protein A3B10_03800 [Candidatus Doudnabacteria bacterium RIFCSPLOWO2_01_FULL_44_21]
MPNTTRLHLRGLTPSYVNGVPINVETFDEYVHTDTNYQSRLKPEAGEHLLFAAVGTQTQQIHRAADLAAIAVRNGGMAIIGGPHSMTCDTSMLQGRGVSFSQAEAEVIWPQILFDATNGMLAPVYGAESRWAESLNPPIQEPLTAEEQKRYMGAMQGVTPARGCPKTCNFCSVKEIFGRLERSQPISVTVQTLLAAQTAGVKLVMFTCDNFNKYGERKELLEAMIAAGVTIPFMVQCDMDLVDQPKLIELLGLAGCYEVFLGAESFDRKVLQKRRKGHNNPKRYTELVELLRASGITAHFSNIVGFEEDTVESIKDGVEQLKGVGPLTASFWILTHIPGTDRYAEVLSAGNVITETNLDRFNGTRPTWRHEQLTDQQQLEMFQYCYREFYSKPQVWATLGKLVPSGRHYDRQRSMAISNARFSLTTVARGEHPMSGGINRVKLDHVSEYLPLRREFYGFEHFPLPQNLRLSAKDTQLNELADDKSWKMASGF